jgi:hypothetical protein
MKSADEFSPDEISRMKSADEFSPDEISRMNSADEFSRMNSVLVG